MYLRLFQGREKIHQITEEERALKEENVRLQRRLMRETERREQLSRQLSESESSLEMEDERYMIVCLFYWLCFLVPQYTLMNITLNIMHACM